MSDNNNFVIEVPYTIHYDVNCAVPIDVIIDTLVSMERMLQRTPKFIEKAYVGLHVIETEVLVSSIVAGSHIQKFLIKYVLGGEDNAEKAKEVFDTMVQNSAAVRTVVAIGVGAMITYGVMSALPSGAPTTHIEAYNSTIINVSSGVLTGEQISEVLSKISDKKSLARDAVNITKPAKLDPTSTIKFNDEEALIIPAAAIAEAPSEYTPATPQEREVKYSDVEVIVYASDRDKSESGWAGIIPQIFERRVNFKLDEVVKPEQLHGRTRIRADVIVHERFVQTKKAYEPKFVEILSVAN